MFKSSQLPLEQQASLQIKNKPLQPNMAYINIGTEGYIQSPEMQEALNAANAPQLRVS